MIRFLAGLVTGGAAGALAFWLTKGNVNLVIFVSVMVMLIVWFTRYADEILESALDYGADIVRAIDKLF